MITINFIDRGELPSYLNYYEIPFHFVIDFYMIPFLFYALFMFSIDDNNL